VVVQCFRSGPIHSNPGDNISPPPSSPPEDDVYTATPGPFPTRRRRSSFLLSHLPSIESAFQSVEFSFDRFGRLSSVWAFLNVPIWKIAPRHSPPPLLRETLFSHRWQLFPPPPLMVKKNSDVFLLGRQYTPSLLTEWSFPRRDSLPRSRVTLPSQN